MNNFFDVSEASNRESPLLKLAKEVKNKESNISALDQPLAKEVNVEKYIGCPKEGNGGHWSGEPGNSDWIPDDDYVPIGQHTNPEGKSWGELKKQYGFDKISFKDGEPDFSEVSKATVEIDNFTDRRTGKGGNFDQADQKLMEQTGMSKEELVDFKRSHTWHEKNDCKTLELVPTDIHGNVSHIGGVSEYKNNN